MKTEKADAIQFDTPFVCIKVGDCYISRGSDGPWMRTEAIDGGNCVSLTTGMTGLCLNDCLVHPLPNAKVVY